MALNSYIAYSRENNNTGDVIEILTGTAQEVVDATRDRRKLYGPVKVANVGYDGQSLWYTLLEYKKPTV